jgi:replicative DNA helicase
MAMEFHIPILALSQLSRAVEQREDKRPQLSDLRESGSIEQDADIVLFVYREEYYLKNAKYSDFNKQLEHERKLAEFKGIAEINIAKQRAGDTGIFNLRFEPEFSRFINYF